MREGRMDSEVGSSSSAPEETAGDSLVLVAVS